MEIRSEHIHQHPPGYTIRSVQVFPHAAEICSKPTASVSKTPGRKRATRSRERRARFTACVEHDDHNETGRLPDNYTASHNSINNHNTIKRNMETRTCRRPPHANMVRFYVRCPQDKQDH